jgi:hypothetical protein
LTSKFFRGETKKLWGKNDAKMLARFDKEKFPYSCGFFHRREKD